jgi:hypothetical protein
MTAANETSPVLTPDHESQSAFSLDAAAKPSKASRVAIREESEEDGKFLLYEPDSEAVLLMNGTGKRIFELCDGQRNVSEIAVELAQEYRVPDEVDLSAVVGKYLTVLARMHIVNVL